MNTFKINVTKKIYEASRFCTLEEGIGSNCAIAKAIGILFPDAWVTEKEIIFFNDISLLTNETTFYTEIGRTKLPLRAQILVNKFDKATPEERLSLPEISFEIKVSDQILEKIVDISEISRILKDCRTLELV